MAIRPLRTARWILQVSAQAISSNEHLACTCPITGISYALTGPALHAAASIPSLQYHNPLAELHNARTYIKRAKLNECSQELLSGLFLALYGHYDLIDFHSTALEANSILQTCKPETLIWALKLGLQINPIMAQSFPLLAIRLPEDRSIDSYDPMLYNYLRIIEMNFPQSDLEKAMYQCAEEGIKLKISSTYIKSQITIARKQQPPKLAKFEVAQPKAKIADLKREAKELINTIAEDYSYQFSDKFRAFLKTLTKGDNLCNCNPVLRAKACTLLMNEASYACERLAELLKDLGQHESIADSLDSALPNKPTRSLADILASKRSA